MDFKKLIEETEAVDGMFGVPLDKRDRVLDLVEEVGELCQAILISEKKKLTNDPLKQKTREHVADALADILFDVVLVARDYEIGLAEEYEAMLKKIKARIAKGEFDER